jgi:hypothetical protein
VPDEVAARVPQTRDYRYAVAKDRVLLVGTGRGRLVDGAALIVRKRRFTADVSITKGY